MVITNEQIEKKFSEIDDVDYVLAEGDGYHYHITVVSDLFIDKPKIARQKWVYGVLNDYILSGDLHAIQMKTLTKSEWEKKHG
jgi:acid stress-induced BolA-like protein IbaG/YrbA